MDIENYIEIALACVWAVGLIFLAYKMFGY
jgi:hypothetical protein